MKNKTRDELGELLLIAIVLGGVLLALIYGCAGLSRADRVKYSLDGMRAACKLYASYPAEIPREPEMDEVCFALDGGDVE